MSRPIRFLGFAILAWAAVRAVSLGMVPGTGALAFDAQASQPARPLPPIQPSLLPPIEPIAPAPAPNIMGMSYAPHAAYPQGAPYPLYAPYPVYVPVQAGAGRSAPPQIIYVTPPPAEPREVHVYGDPLPGSGEKLAMAETTRPTTPVPQSTPSFTERRQIKGLDRLSLTGWAMMREQPGPHSLAGRGTLGGSEVGARLMWKFDPRLAASLRFSAPANSQRGAEAALGLRYQPFANWPVAVTLERRQHIRDYGRDAFAGFVEGGVYGRPLPWRTTLDGYVQVGVVDFNNPDWFVDGQLAVSRPVWRNLSAGAGVWGGGQPGLYRVDVGPRASLHLGRGMRMHLDYRFNVAGNAAPGSGGVVTLAGDF